MAKSAQPTAEDGSISGPVTGAHEEQGQKKGGRGRGAGERERERVCVSPRELFPATLLSLVLAVLYQHSVHLLFH